MVLRRIAAIVRMMLGGGFVILGVAKLLDEEFLFGGLVHRLGDTGNAFPLYQRFINRIVEMHQEEFAYAAALGEILVGISLLSGLWVSGGVLGGIFLVANFALATTWGNIPMMLAHVALIALLAGLGCCGAGLTWGCDGWLVQRLSPRIVLFPWRRRLPESI